MYKKTINIIKHTLMLLILFHLIGCSISNNEWKILFDGKNTDQWRGFNKDYFPNASWKIENNTLKTVMGVASTVDIITKEKYQNFELELDWKISKGGNSGIFYFVSESQNYIWQTAPECKY